MRSVELRVSSGHRLVTDLTSEAASFVADQADGLLSVFVPHATAGVALIETGAGTEPDLADALERLLPTADIYRHRHGSLGHGRDHVMPAFVSPSLTIPVIGGGWHWAHGRASFWWTPMGTIRGGPCACPSCRGDSR